MKVLEAIASQCRLYSWEDLDADVTVYKLVGEEYKPMKQQKTKVTVDFKESKFVVKTKSQEFICLLSFLDYKACELISINNMPKRMVVFDIYFDVETPPF